MSQLCRMQLLIDSCIPVWPGQNRRTQQCLVFVHTFKTEQMTTFQQRFLLFVVNTSTKNYIVYVSLHTRAKQEFAIVNIREDIQTNNFVMLKIELLSHCPHTAASCTNKHENTGITQFYVVYQAYITYIDICNFHMMLHPQLRFSIKGYTKM